MTYLITVRAVVFGAVAGGLLLAPATAFPQLCGDGVKDLGEDCDPSALSPDNECLDGRVGTALRVCNPDCTCPCPGAMEFAWVGDLVDLDVGWTGMVHDQTMPNDFTFTFRVSTCAGGRTRPCGVCAVSGPLPNDPSGPASGNFSRSSNQRCTDDTSVECTADSDCVGGSCQFWATVPMAVSGGGVPTCVMNQFEGPLAGTVDVEGGSAAVHLGVMSRVFSGILVSQPCPTCDGDPAPSDGSRDGSCNGGERNGLPCDVGGTHSRFGTTSLDCPPLAGTEIGLFFPLALSLATGTSTRTLSGASPDCTSAGWSGFKCMCDTCATANGEPCFTDADCPGAATCGGKRCLGGTANGMPCTADSECDPVSPFCGRLGEPTSSNSCLNGPTDCVHTVQPSPPNSLDEGVCASGPFDPACVLEPFRGCSADSDCPAPGDLCAGEIRECFTTDGTTTGDNDVTAAGNPDPDPKDGGPDLALVTWAGLFCVGPTQSAAVNIVSGFPGLTRLTLPGTEGGLPPLIPCQADSECNDANPATTDVCNPSDPGADSFGCVQGPAVADADGDGVSNDGDGSGIAGDNPCPSGQTTNCDDNCPSVFNPDQLNSDGEGGGDLCDPCPAKATNDCTGSAGANVGTAGGGINLDGKVIVTVPPGAVSQDTSVTVTDNTDEFSLFTQAGFASGTVRKIALRPQGVAFNEPIGVRLVWDDLDGDNIVDAGVCADLSTPCDDNAACATQGAPTPCLGGGSLPEEYLRLKKDTNIFSNERCGSDPHTPGGTVDCLGATATCPNGAPVAKCCDQGANSWEFEVCSFSEIFLGLSAGDLIPGRGSVSTDCVSEWAVNNPQNQPLFDHKGQLNIVQTCSDGDSLCDADGVVNGRCVFEVGVCLNNDDPRLVRKGQVACSPSDVSAWQLRKPRPDSKKAAQAANAVALRDAVLALGAGTVGGKHQETVSFAPALSGGDVCTELVGLTVPLKGKNQDKPGKATLKARALTGGSTKDSDKLKLVCVPSSP